MDCCCSPLGSSNPAQAFLPPAQFALNANGSRFLIGTNAALFVPAIASSNTYAPSISSPAWSLQNAQSCTIVRGTATGWWLVQLTASLVAVSVCQPFLAISPNGAGIGINAAMTYNLGTQNGDILTGGNGQTIELSSNWLVQAAAGLTLQPICGTKASDPSDNSLGISRLTMTLTQVAP